MTRPLLATDYQENLDRLQEIANDLWARTPPATINHQLAALFAQAAGLYAIASAVIIVAESIEASEQHKPPDDS